MRMLAGIAAAGNANSPVKTAVRSPIPSILLVVIGCLPVMETQWHLYFDLSQNREVQIESYFSKINAKFKSSKNKIISVFSSLFAKIVIKFAANCCLGCDPRIWSSAQPVDSAQWIYAGSGAIPTGAGIAAFRPRVKGPVLSGTMFQIGTGWRAKISRRRNAAKKKFWGAEDFEPGFSRAGIRSGWLACWSAVFFTAQVRARWSGWFWRKGGPRRPL
jgi:hypothetical protein